MRTRLAMLFPVLLLGCQGQIGADQPGGTGSGSDNIIGTSCNPPGATEACCGGGVRTCTGTEITSWGACVAPNGDTLTCCTPTEFSACEGEPDAGALPPVPMLCEPGTVNNEQEILVGYAPDNQQSVGANGQIKVWVNDEHAEIIAPGEQIDPATGLITAPGDRAAKAPDGYLWEPALYIAPMSAENGGTPHFPAAIKGDYNNTLQAGPGVHVPGMDPVPPGSVLQEQYTTEVIWDVSSLGLSQGTYIAEFVIHDGDRDRGIGCVTIMITTAN